MKTLLPTLAAALVTASAAFADTLELADGTLLEGDLVGSSNGIIMFNTGDSIEAYPESEVVGIYLSDGVATRQKEQQQQSSQMAMFVMPLVAACGKAATRQSSKLELGDLFVNL